MILGILYQHIKPKSYKSKLQGLIKTLEIKNSKFNLNFQILSLIKESVSIFSWIYQIKIKYMKKFQ